MLRIDKNKVRSSGRLGLGARHASSGQPPATVQTHQARRVEGGARRRCASPFEPQRGSPEPHPRGMERGPSLSPNRRPHQPLQSGAPEARSLRGRARRCGSARWGGRPGAASPPRCLRGGSGRGPAPWAVNKDAGQVPSALWSALSGDPVGSAGLASAFARLGGGRLGAPAMLFWHTQPEHYNQHNSSSYLR